jgi:membrane-bound lytic murein transglycosylase C
MNIECLRKVSESDILINGKNNVMFKLTIITLLLLSSSLLAQQANDDPFAELEAELNTNNAAQSAQQKAFNELDAALEQEAAVGSPEYVQEFENWKKTYLQEYQNFREKHFGKMDDIRDNLLNTWGEAEVSEQSKYVEYSEDNSTKTVFDFENDEIRVSVIHDKNIDVGPEAAVQALNDIIAKDTAASSSAMPSLVQSISGAELDTTEILQLVETAQVEEGSVKAAEDPATILEQEIATITQQTKAQEQQIEKVYDVIESKDTALTFAEIKAKRQAESQFTKEEADAAAQTELQAQADAEALAESQANVKEAKLKKEYAQIKKLEAQRLARLKQQAAALANNKGKRDELVNKRITTYTIPLKNQKHAKRATPYIERVREQSIEYSLTPSLVFALIHTESYFNPKAKSHIPAFGLMQIVPRTAGHDVNRFLFGIDAPMAEDRLLKPTENIEAGTAYLHILFTRYLKKIENPQSRLYCAIAAYNTGSGNVAKTFNPDGARNINKAAKIINKLTPQQVYDRLIEN